MNVLDHLQPEEEELVCEKCEGGGYIMMWNTDGTDKVESGIPCDCQREEEEATEWPCQDLFGGWGAAIRAHEDGLCSHPACKPEEEDG